MEKIIYTIHQNRDGSDVGRRVEFTGTKARQIMRMLKCFDCHQPTFFMDYGITVYEASVSE